MRSSDLSGLHALGAGPLAPSRDLEIITLDASGAIEIRFATTELMAHCPVTNQRDLYDATIEITGTATLESKSLKLYLGSFDEERILAEDLTNTMADDLAVALGDSASRISVRLQQNVRGGISITTTAIRPLPIA